MAAAAVAKSALDESSSLEAEEKLLALEAAGVPDEAAGRTDDPMARDDDRNGVSVEGSADRPRCLRLPDACGETSIRVHPSVGDSLELGEDTLLEGGKGAQIDGKVELVAPAFEIFVELAAGFVHGPRRAQHADPVLTGKALDLLLWIGIEGDLAEAALGCGDEKRADRGVGQVVGDVEQGLGGCPVAEGEVGLGGNGHVILLRSRRTPDEAA